MTLRWHPFELNPAHARGRAGPARAPGAEIRQLRPSRARRRAARLSALGESLGFTFDYFDGMRMVNTFRAHQLLHWADGQGRQTELKLALFEAFFSRREDVNDPGCWLAVAARAGLDSARRARCWPMRAMRRWCARSNSTGWTRRSMPCRRSISSSSTWCPARRKLRPLCACCKKSAPGPASESLPGRPAGPLGDAAGTGQVRLSAATLR